jgi:hypothetical protein
MTLLTSRPSPARPAFMFSVSRTTTLLAIVALAACLVAPVGASAQSAPGEEQYKFEPPTAGEGGEAAADDGQGDQGSSGVPAAAADSADDGGLPILLIVLAGTALAGAAIAIIRRQKT